MYIKIVIDCRHLSLHFERGYAYIRIGRWGWERAIA